MALKNLCLVSFVLLLLVGCTSKFNLKAYEPGDDADGIVYALPKARVAIKIPFTVSHSMRLVEGEYMPAAKAVIGSVSVVTATVPDNDNYFQIDTTIADSATWKNSFEASISEGLSLTKSGVTTEDGLLTATNAVLGTVAKVRDLVERSEEDDEKKKLMRLAKVAVAEITLLEKVVENSRKSLNNLMRSNATGDPTKAEQERVNVRMAYLKKVIAESSARIAALTNIRPGTKSFEIVCEVIFGTNPKTTKIDKDSCETMKSVYAQLDKLGVTVVKLPSSFWFVLDGSPKTPSAFGVAETGINKYVYRVPYRGTFRIRKNSATGALLAENTITVPQLGPFGVLEVKSKAFSKQKIVVELHENTGGLKSYSSTRENLAAGDAATGVGAITSTVGDATKGKSEAEALEAKNKLMEAQIKAIELAEKLEGLEQ